MPVIPEFSPGQALPQGPSVERSMNLMQRAAQSRRQEELYALERPVLEANAAAQVAEAKLRYDSVVRNEASRAQALSLYNKAADDFDFINTVTDDRVRANLSREWLGRYAQLANVKELKGEMDQRTHVAMQNITDMLKINMLKTAETRSFEALTSGFSEEEKAAAAKVKTGLQARPSSAAIKYEKIIGPDGREMFIAANPRAVGVEVIGSGQQYGTPPPGGGMSPAPAGVEGQAVPGAQPAPQQPQQNVFQGPTPQDKKTAEKTAEVVVEARSKLPKALSSLEALEAKTARVEAEIDEAIALASSSTAGFGSIMKHLPATDARKLAAFITSIGANIGFDSLTEMRQNSPTGGALGNVSDYEGKNLQATLGTLDQGLSAPDLKKALLKVKRAREEALNRVRDAYERDVKAYGAPTDGTPDLKAMSTEELEARLQKIQGQKP